jgi:hypothetical protein|tara:strand:- start:495 stop:1475 length:981 start_codon:yes stop_codon:yes gene_type:complete
MKQDYWTYNKPLSMAGLGGGATSLSNAGGSPFTYDDAAYDNFFTKSKSAINISNSSYDDVTSYASGYNSPSGISPFYDHDQGKIFIHLNGFGTSDVLQAYTWPEAGNTYSGSASFYQVQGHSTTSLSTSPSTGSSRGLTIGYLQDDTAVFVRTMSSGVNRLHFHYYPSGTYIGYLTMFEAASYGSNDPKNIGAEQEICFDGTHILFMDENNSGYIFGYDMPANAAAINSSNTNKITTSRRWTSNFAGGMIYGMVWTGDGVIYNDYGTGYAYYERLSGTGYSGTHTSVRSYQFYGGTSSNFGVGMDYKNRKIILGGYQEAEMRVYGE